MMLILFPWCFYVVLSVCGLYIRNIHVLSRGYKPRFPVWNYPSNHHYMIYEQLEVLHLQVSVVFKCLKGFSVHTIMIEKYISTIHWKIAVECYLKMSKWFQTYLQKRWMRFSQLVSYPIEIRLRLIQKMCI